MWDCFICEKYLGTTHFYDNKITILKILMINSCLYTCWWWCESKGGGAIVSQRLNKRCSISFWCQYQSLKKKLTKIRQIRVFLNLVCILTETPTFKWFFCDFWGNPQIILVGFTKKKSKPIFKEVFEILVSE